MGLKIFLIIFIYLIIGVATTTCYYIWDYVENYGSSYSIYSFDIEDEIGMILLIVLGWPIFWVVAVFWFEAKCIARLIKYLLIKIYERNANETENKTE